jgi:hypothetical protein
MAPVLREPTQSGITAVYAFWIVVALDELPVKRDGVQFLQSAAPEPAPPPGISRTAASARGVHRVRARA